MDNGSLYLVPNYLGNLSNYEFHKSVKKVINNIQYFIGSHNGYDRLDKYLKYFRTIIMVKSNILI